MSGPTVFISYSHKDESWKDRLVRQLLVLQMEGVLEVWNDGRIAAGNGWRSEIQAAMERAKIALLLVSADFLTSRFIRGTEIPELLKRRAADGLRIIPVIVRPCPWQRVGWLADLQYRPRDGRPLAEGRRVQIDKDLSDLAEEIADLLETDERSDRPLPSQARRLDLGRLPTPGPHFVGRSAELTRLDAAWEEPDVHVLTLVAFGGTGKSTLLARWLARLADEHWRGAQHVLDWSFGSQGADAPASSVEQFLDHALRTFGDPDPKAGSPHDRGVRLADLVRRRRTLLVLDGIEPLQHPPGPFEGRIKEPGFGALLKGLAAANLGLCVLTTRRPIPDLAPYAKTAPQIHLETLRTESGIELLRRLGVHGSLAELRSAVEELGGHPLTLTLIGNYLRKAHGGNVRKWHEVELGKADAREGGYALRVIAAYARWLGEGPELAILRLLGFFGLAADAAALAALRAAPPIIGLTDSLTGLSEEDWRWSISSLREHGLLTAVDPSKPGSLDTHPLVRAYFSEELKAVQPEAWKAGNLLLYDHFKSAAPETPDTLQAMQPLYAAIIHGCRGGRPEEALNDVYWRRVQRQDQFYGTRLLGAFGSALNALAGLFERPWSHPLPSLSVADQGFVLSEVGFLLRALGRLTEAIEPMRASLELAIAREDWANAAAGAGNLSELSLTLGEVPRAVMLGEQSVRLADLSGDFIWQITSRSTLADALHHAGKWQESMAIFHETEGMQAHWQPQLRHLYSLAGFRYCDLLLSHAEPEDGSGLDGFTSNRKGRQRFWRACQETLRRATEGLEGQTPAGSLLDLALNHLSLGRAYLGLTVASSRSNRPGKSSEIQLPRAAEHLERAVNGLRRSGNEDYLPRGLLLRASFRRITADFDPAGADLIEALEIAERGFMRLHECDVHLEWARLHRDQGRMEEARRHLAEAHELVSQTGYGRRSREVAHLKRVLGV